MYISVLLEELFIMFFIFTVVIFVTLSQVAVNGQKPPPPPYSTDLETQLRNELFDANYSVLQRPSQKVVVFLSLTLFTINELDIKNQILSLSGYLSLKWTDGRLSWTNTATDYSSIIFLFSSETYAWRPSVIIENSVEDISIIGHPYIPMRIFNTGAIDWNPMGIYKVHCESDITYYPLDQQSCDIKITTWGYTTREITLIFGNPAIEMGFYSENGEWEIIHTTGTRSMEKSRGGQSFPSLTFNLKLRRRLIFHVLNTLFPVALLAFLIPLVFKLHVDSGEKIGYALTVLLAYAVYLTLISENIPSTSVSVCYLSIYLALTLGLGTFAVFCTILVINVNHVPDHKPIPGWIKRFTLCFRSGCSCCAGKKCCYCCRQEHDTAVKPLQLNDIPDSVKNKKMKIKADILNDPFNENKSGSEDDITWRDVSKSLDLFFFYIYFILVVVATVVLCVVVFSHYISTE